MSALFASRWSPMSPSGWFKDARGQARWGHRVPPWRVLVMAVGLSAPALSHAQIVTSGTIAVAAGGALQDGDRAAYQQRMRHKKDGYGGIENFTWSRTTDATLLRIDARAIPGDEDYQFTARWEKFDALYVEAS